MTTDHVLLVWMNSLDHKLALKQKPENKYASLYFHVLENDGLIVLILHNLGKSWTIFACSFCVWVNSIFNINFFSWMFYSWIFLDNFCTGTSFFWSCWATQSKNTIIRSKNTTIQDMELSVRGWAEVLIFCFWIALDSFLVTSFFLFG